MTFGEEAVRLARAAAENEAGDGPEPAVPEGFSEFSGAFVTLNSYPSGELRGCIGYPAPVFPLGEAIAGAAREACRDPRFPVLRKEELSRVTVEVTVLTVPEVLRGAPEEIRQSVKIGRDGLIVECFGRRGLLLPQVPAEFGWDAGEYLEHLCLKAGLPPESWKLPEARIYSFRGRIWAEETPRGPVSERNP